MTKLKSHYQFFINSLEKIYTIESRKSLLFLIIVYSFGFLPIILADVYYIDDLERSIRGYRGWDNFSRFSSNFLSSIFNMSDRLTDISPLTQIISIIVLSFGSLILVLIFNKKHNCISLLGSTFVGLSPFYLENISYKFDSPYMSIAVLSAIFPFLFVKNNTVFGFIGILSLLLMYTTYQAANSIFIIISLFYILYLLIEKENIKEIVCQLFLFSVIFIIATLIYKFLIVIETDSYVSSKSLPLNMLLSGLYANFIKYYSIILNSLNDTVIIKLSICIFLLIPINIWIKTRNYIKSIASLVIIILAFLLSFGLYLILEKPLYALRSFNGIGMLIAISCIFMIMYSIKFTRFISGFIIIILIYNSYIISYSYGNALKAQDKYNSFRIDMMLQDLNKSISNFKNYKIYISSEGRMSPAVENSQKVYPIISKLVQTYNQKNWSWTSVQIYKHKLVDAQFVKFPCANKDINVTKLIETTLHNLTFYANDCVFIYYK